MDKEKGLYAIEHYSVLKRKETYLFAATQINLEDTMLSERSQMQKDKCCIFSVMGGT